MAGGGNFKLSIRGQIHRGYRSETVQENIEELLREVDSKVTSDYASWSGFMFICSWIGALGEITSFQRSFEKIRTSTGKYFQASVFDLVMFYEESEG